MRLSFSIAAVVALLLVPAARGDAFDDAAKLVPPDAAGVLLLPSPKLTSDDLQLTIDRMGRAETGLGGRPIDLLKSRLGIGAGFDDRAPLACWVERRDARFVMVAALGVTDADAFIKANLTPVPEAGPDAYRTKEAPDTIYARGVGKHVIVAQEAASVRSYEPGAGIGATLATRLGERGLTIARRADCCLWAGSAIFADHAAQLRAAEVQGAGERAAQLGAPVSMTDAQLASARDRGAQLLEQVTDGLIAVDFDALAVGVRAFARFAPGGELAGVIPAAAGTPREVTTALGLLPAGPNYGALGVDLAGMGGARRIRTFLETLPGAQQLQPPEWLDAVQDKVTALQVAAFPSKLGVLAGGVLNDAAFVIVTADPAAVKEALHTWISAQAGERDGIRREPVWEAERVLKNGTTVSAFAVKEVVTGAGGEMTSRLLRQVIVGARGMHGFAKEVPGALVVTYSQRADVLERALAAASGGGARTLGNSGLVRSMAPWLVPDPDIVAFLGVGELLGAARQVAGAVPGGVAEMVPSAPEGLEPIAAALRAKDASWEAAIVVPSGVLAIAYDVIKAQIMRDIQGAPQGKPAPADTPGAGDSAAPEASPAPVQP